MKEKSIISFFINFRIVILVLLVVLILNMYAFNISIIARTSMESTLEDRDVVIVNKMFNPSKLDYGEIIIFILDEDVNSGFFSKIGLIFGDITSKFKGGKSGARYVKRIVARENDKVDIVGGRVIVNDFMVNEPYIDQMTGKGVLEYPLIVPKDCYFVLGDNREVSKDSRTFGVIKKENIEGKLVYRILPFSKIGTLDRARR